MAEHEQRKKKDADAVRIGHKGGLKGGPARANALTPKERTKIARMGAAARWRKKG
jgi:hypothetical protein